MSGKQYGISLHIVLQIGAQITLEIRMILRKFEPEIIKRNIDCLLYSVSNKVFAGFKTAAI